MERQQSGNPGDGRARTTGDCSKRVVRGGSCYYNPEYLRSACRIWFPSVDRYYNSGFRLATTLAH